MIVASDPVTSSILTSETKGGGCSVTNVSLKLSDVGNVLSRDTCNSYSVPASRPVNLVCTSPPLNVNRSSPIHCPSGANRKRRYRVPPSAPSLSNTLKVASDLEMFVNSIVAHLSSSCADITGEAQVPNAPYRDIVAKRTRVMRRQYNRGITI